ncbi:MAG: gamma-glutamyltransferase, partial [Gaiellaceae bacterium]
NRIRSAILQTVLGVVDHGLPAQEAVSSPRIHVEGREVDAEPGVDEDALTELQAAGRTVRRWDRIHHYFGGVSCVGRDGAAGDPRRSGAAFRV